MDVLFDFVRTISDMGAATMLPILITLLALFFRMKFGEALKSGILVGIGFLGIGLVVGLLSDSIAPAIDYYTEIGGGFVIADIGWGAVGGSSWTVPFAGLAVPVGFAINLILVRTKIVKTLNVDIWNYMHFLVPGALAYYIFNSFWIGFLTTIVLSVLSLFIGDKIAPAWQEYYGLEGTTSTTLIHTGWTYPFSWLVNKILDFIPGIDKIDFSIEEINKKLGVFGEPSIIGVIVGTVLGIITRQEITTILVMGIGVAGVMILMPRVVGVLMDGLTPIGNAAQKYVMDRMDDDAEIYIGMDVALGLGDPATITVTVVSIPLIMLAALVLPNIQMFPIGLLTSVIYISVMTVLASKGNVLRSIITTVLFGIMVMYLGAYVAPGATRFLEGAGIELQGLGTDFVLTGPWSVIQYWLSTLFQ